jgi:hypothetical protein
VGDAPDGTVRHPGTERARRNGRNRFPSQFPGFDPSRNDRLVRDGKRLPTTDASGAYELRVPDAWSGVVTPSKPHWVFTPPSRSYSNVTADQNDQNYSGLPNGRTLSGSIRAGDGSVMAGVKVTANNGGGTARTDAAGVYVVTVPTGWSGVVLPSMDRSAFSPPSRGYSHVTADQSAQNYTVTPRPPALLGSARTAEGAGIPEVTILANNGGGSVTTDASGAYSLIVPERWSGTVMPFKTGYEFSPLSRDYFTVMSDQASQDYAGRPAAAIYVDAGAHGKNDGSSWANAFVYLQDALTKALPGDTLRVAEGLYWPDLGMGQNLGDRAATFQLKNGLVVYGGFPKGGGEGSQRNPRMHQTILSGDIGKTGVATDNSYHVVSANGLSLPVVLDGCVIAGGYANVVLPTPRKDQGAGLFSVQSRLQVRNCIFVGNTATGQGGGAYAATSDVTFINCLFTGNTGNDGGALYNEPGTVALINCTLVANQGLWRASVARPTTVVNSILWGNPGRPNRTTYDDLAQLSGGLPPMVNFCCVQGWSKSLGAEDALTGKGNLDSDPLFVQAAGADGIAGTQDDDLRLQASSPCLDQGDNTALPPEVLTDLEGRPRILNRTVDLGAYESGTVAANP